MLRYSCAAMILWHVAGSDAHVVSLVKGFASTGVFNAAMQSCLTGFSQQHWLSGPPHRAAFPLQLRSAGEAAQDDNDELLAMQLDSGAADESSMPHAATMAPRPREQPAAGQSRSPFLQPSRLAPQPSLNMIRPPFPAAPAGTVQAMPVPASRPPLQPSLQQIRPPNAAAAAVAEPQAATPGRAASAMKDPARARRRAGQAEVYTPQAAGPAKPAVSTSRQAELAALPAASGVDDEDLAALDAEAQAVLARHPGTAAGSPARQPGSATSLAAGPSAAVRARRQGLTPDQGDQLWYFVPEQDRDTDAAELDREIDQSVATSIKVCCRVWVVEWCFQTTHATVVPLAQTRASCVSSWKWKKRSAEQHLSRFRLVSADHGSHHSLLLATLIRVSWRCRRRSWLQLPEARRLSSPPRLWMTTASLQPQPMGASCRPRCGLQLLLRHGQHLRCRAGQTSHQQTSCQTQGSACIARHWQARHSANTCGLVQPLLPPGSPCRCHRPHQDRGLRISQVRRAEAAGATSAGCWKPRGRGQCGGMCLSRALQRRKQETCPSPGRPNRQLAGVGTQHAARHSLWPPTSLAGMPGRVPLMTGMGCGSTCRSRPRFRRRRRTLMTCCDRQT